jgi:hypothetical protein
MSLTNFGSPRSGASRPWAPRESIAGRTSAQPHMLTGVVRDRFQMPRNYPEPAARNAAHASTNARGTSGHDAK